MKTIWKFPLEITEDQTIEVPRDAQVLSVQVQPMSVAGDGGLMLWALVDPSMGKVTRHVRVVGTGDSVMDMPGQFVGTVQLGGGAMVWHVFVAPEVVGL